MYSTLRDRCQHKYFKSRSTAAAGTALKYLRGALLTLCCLLLPTLSPADVKVAGVTLPATHDVAGQTLQLNGAGIRSKFFVKVYVGALYLAQTARSTDAALSMQGAKVMRMDILHGHVDAEKIRSAWKEGFEANLDGDAAARLAARLERFNALFPDLNRGDIILIAHDPATGTHVSINGAERGTIEGADFFAALLCVWIGTHPADGALKKALLGD